MPDRIETRCPVVRAERGRFVRMVDVEGLERNWVPIPFERDVEYVRESETSVVVTLPEGKVVKEIETNNDWYGYLTSPQELMGCATRAAEEFAAFDGPLVVELRVTITENALVPIPDPAFGAQYGRRAYLAVPNGWLVDDEATAAHLAAVDLEAKIAAQPTRMSVSETTHVAWTSADGRDGGARSRRFSDMLDAALADVPDDVADKVRKYDFVVEAIGGVASGRDG